MNRIILVGNGFDLAHGLKTSYNDFILDLVKGKINEAINNGRKEKILETSVKRGYFYTDKLLDIYVKEFSNIQSFEDKIIQATDIKSIRDYFKINNCEFKFISKIIDDYFEKWSDLEVSYFKNLYEAFNKKESCEKLNTEFDLIHKNLIKYIKKNQIDFSKSEFNKTNVEILMDYIHNGDPREILFLNFNYTNTLNNYINRLHSFIKSNIIYIHGNINDHKNIDELIFGYDNDEYDKFNEIINHEDIEFINYFKSVLYNNNRNKANLKNFIFSSPFEVFCMGHSLGQSDNTILKEIFANPNCQSIKIFYNPHTKLEDFNAKNKLLRKLLKKEKEFEKLFPRSESNPLPILINE